MKLLTERILKFARKYRIYLLTLSMAVVFVTTYALILPAITLDEEEAMKQGGIDLPKTEQNQDSQAKKDEGISADTDAAGTDADKADRDSDTAGPDSGAADKDSEANEDAASDGGSGSDSDSDSDKTGAEGSAQNSGQQEEKETGSSRDEDDGNSPDAANAADTAGTLTFAGKGFGITAECGPDAGLPADTKIMAEEIPEDDEDYEGYRQEALKALQEQEGGNKNGSFSFIRLYDITLTSDGAAIEPDAPIDVTISYDKPVKASDEKTGDADNIRIVHYGADKKGKLQTEVLDPEDVTATMKKDKLQETTFTAESFSVYAVVYTVDFHWEIDGKKYDFSMPGGGYMSFTKLMEVLGVAGSGAQSEAGDGDKASEAQEEQDAALTLDDVKVSEETKKFVEDVEKVEFSAPDLVWVQKIEEDTTVGQLKEKNKLECEYSYRLTWDEIEKINATAVEAGDWGIISLKAFDTTEQLKVTMKDGREFIIRVTDYAAYTPVEDDGVTIPNPSGTTMNLFDYWVDNSLKNRTGKSAWPGYNGNNNYTNSYHNGQTLRGSGNNSGINSWSGNANEGHALKFNPSDENTVIDGTYRNWRQISVNGARRINSWVGNADPLQGLVEPVLNANGYPKLTNNSNLGTNGEDLDYLFDGTQGNNMGKAVYPGVDGLLYVDRDGYYTYDSRDFAATYNNGRFNLTPFTNESGGPRGFWPFGSEKFWLGLHMKVDFSMPSNGKVLNPSGVYKDMEFSFSGDDDTWIYVDGILVGDGGGVHNRTQIDVNFREGTVRVRGTEDPDYPGSMDTTTYLEDYYRAQNRFVASEWTEVLDDDGKVKTRMVNGQERPILTFVSGTDHDLQMFYMERGGGFSNLMIHYNLISTTDFSAHKSYHNTNGSVLKRNDYKFELVGYDNPEYASEGAEFVKAIMPSAVTWDATKPSGTFENPLWQTVPASGTTGGYRSLTIGNTEDGNVNFGDVELSPSYVGKQYKYMVREVVPDNAVNADGVRWADASEELKREGGFSLNGITYDAKVYYFIGKVVETAPGVYEVKKERYLDPECTQPDTQTKFFSFVNGEETPVSLKVNKKSDTEAPLDGAVFSLTRAMKNTDEKWVVREWKINNTTYHSQPVTGTTSGGTLTFDDLTEGHYILEEMEAPAGYQMGDQHRWLLTLEKQDSKNKILLVPYITPLDADGSPAGNRVALDLPDDENTIEYEVLNGPLPPIDLSLEKKWNDNGDTSVPTGAEATFELHRIRNESPVTVRLLDSQGAKIDEVTAFVGDTIKIYDTGTDAFRHYIQKPSYFSLLNPFSSNVRSESDTVTPSDSNWTITTTNIYSLGFFEVNLDSSTASSNGQYTVKRGDITAGVVQLRLDRTYIGATYNYFEVPPKLYVSNSAGGPETVDEVISTFTLKAQNGDGDAGNPWKKSFADLPVVDENGNPCSYYFKEVNHAPADYNRPTYEGEMGSAESPLTDSGDIIVTNSTPELPKITAAKVWKDENGNPIDDEAGLDGLEVKLTLYKGTSPAPASEVKTGEVTRTVAGGETATWYLLDEHADVNNYTVKETAVKIPGGDFITVDPDANPSENPFGGEVSGDPSTGFTVTNQLPATQIEVTKQWKDGTSANDDKVFNEAKAINFTVYQKLGSNDGAAYTVEGEPVTGTVTYTPASGGTAASWSTETVPDLPKYKYSDGSWYEAQYYPVEDEISGVTVTYQKTGGSASEDPEDAAAASGTVTIINTDIVFPLKIVKVDKDSGEGLSGAKFQLTRKLPGEGSFTKFVNSSFEEDPENENKKTGPFTVSSTAGMTLEGLFPGEYRIEETESPAGYIISLQPCTFTINGDGTITLPDTVDDELVNLLEGSDPAGLKIGNESGVALPNSGGPGTTWIYILGSLLLLVAGVIMVSRRRIREDG